MSKKASQRKGLGPKEETLRQWVLAGVRRPGKSQKGLAAAIDRSEGTVSKICKGTRPVSLEEIEPISKYFGNGHPPPNGVAATQTLKTGETGKLSGNEVDVSTGLLIEAIIAQDVWVTGGVVSTVALRASIPSKPDPRFTGMRQYACALRSDPNQFIVCVPYAAMRSSPVHDDKVHVRRTRTNGEYEDTIRVVKIVSGKTRLLLEGAPDDDKGLAYPSKRPGEQIEIRGYLIGRWTAENT